MGDNDTHPVYIDSDRKSEVKKTAAGQDSTMKDITERLVEHGLELGLHELPLDEEPIFEESENGIELIIPEPESEEDADDADSSAEASA